MFYLEDFRNREHYGDCSILHMHYCIVQYCHLFFRYPTFESALRDLDDALCLLFAFSVLPHTKIITSSLVASSRRLTAEFNHYIIESKSLSKVSHHAKRLYISLMLLLLPSRRFPFHQSLAVSMRIW